jgi:sensor histidine kinase YesM
MKKSIQSRHKAILQISRLMLFFLVASSFANASLDRYAFVYLYAIGFTITAVHLWLYKKNMNHDAAALRIVVTLFFLFFSFYFIGEQKTFDILWVLILPVVTFILGDYYKTRTWLSGFLILLVVMMILQVIYPQYIQYEGFALWSMLWAGIFFSGMVLYYKRIQEDMENELEGYQSGLEKKVVKSLGEIKSLRTEKEEIDYKLLQSRLGSLETQLNPHFMFNALNSIAELVHQDSDKAEQAIVKVSSFLRNTMNEKTMLSLSDEIYNVKAYIDVENIRFSQSIKLEIAAKIPKWNVPKFSLQLLVENAIKHGFISQEKPLHIGVDFDEKKRMIIMENDGKTMDEIHFGIGLTNLQQRLHLLCKGRLEAVTSTKPRFTIYIGSCNETINR